MWSKEKKVLESRLALSLKGKVKYNLEGGRKPSWTPTYKVEILYNKQPIIKFSEGLNYITSHYEMLERNKLDEIKWTREETYQLFLKVQKQLWIEEIYTTDMFFIGMRDYLSLSIDKAISSDEWMVRLFTLLDKRLGKRRLIRLKDEVKTYPKKLIELYKIRMKEEGLENEVLDM